MGHIPASKDYDPAPGLFFRHSEAIMNMGLTAEYLAMKYQVPRTAQDEFAARSTSSPPASQPARIRQEKSS